MDKKLTALIVEDEPFVRADLCYILRRHPQMGLLKEAGSVADAKAALNACHFDAVFLDIQIRGGSGFDVLDAVPIDTPVIFFTSHEEYAVQAFDIDALDYLVKPVSEERLFQTIERLISLKALEKKAASAETLGQDEIIRLSTTNRKVQLHVNDIIAISSVGGNYTSVHITDAAEETLTVRMTFKEWQHILPTPPFERIHRQSIANMQYLLVLDKMEGGNWQLRLRGLSDPLDISRRCLSTVKRYA